AEELLREARIGRLRQWVELADQKLAGSSKRMIMNAGNDDPFYIDDVLHSGEYLECPEARVIELGDLSMVSVGYANMTPWICPRDIPEEELARKIDAAVDQVTDLERCIFNLHAPPYGTQLDLAVGLDAELRPSMSFGADETHVGSRAVRAAIEKYQPLLALHGHIHEQHAFIRIGRTICVNPGSEYHLGQLRGFYVEFDGRGVRRFGLTREEIV
ncbi:MAG TPA: metallophosphoesterase, partial [Thermoanaerobaculia bacterium]|nr:metallophosphoesterase [Thermoanaerobaculia bacterium]